MRKNWLTLGVLFACVAALGLFVWLKPSKPKDTLLSVTTLKAAEARTLQVTRQGQRLAALEKRGNEWMLVEPLNAPADSLQVARLLAVLDAKSATQYPATDLAKFELATPAAEIAINNERYAFGAINNVTREQYVLAQNQVYALELRFGAAIPSNAMALVRRSVLAAGDQPQRFEFGAFTVASDDRKWITTPSGGEASQDDFNRWVAQWREGSALRVTAADKRASEKTIHIVLKDGRKIELGVVQTEPELIVRRADLGLQFVFVGDIGAQMLSPPLVRDALKPKTEK